MAGVVYGLIRFSYGQSVQRTGVQLEALLDRLEHGEIRAELARRETRRG